MNPTASIAAAVPAAMAATIPARHRALDGGGAAATSSTLPSIRSR